jgi:phosphoribosylformylglycinamidine synthase I
MRIGIVQFPGSNCERETMLAVKRAGMEPVEFLWNQSKTELADFAGYIIVGGFSYEDRSRSGIIAALDPIMAVIQEQSEIGKPVLGICNGAQILVETGLVPGIANHQVGMALTDNKRMQDGRVLGTGFYNAWVHMRLTDQFQYNAFTRFLAPHHILHVPVAHGEGRFVIPPGLLAEMQVQGLGLFQYCDAEGHVVDTFPTNPNGSVNNIAAVSNKAGNVMAMMPHPERTPNGDAIFASMREHIAKGYCERVAPLYYQPRPSTIRKYQPVATAHEMIVNLIITDNQAVSVENALQHNNIEVQMQRQEHWEIECDSPEILEKIRLSGVLYNDQKQVLVEKTVVKSAKQATFLVRSQDDMIGLQKQQMLENHFGIEGIKTIRHSILWSVAADNNLRELSQRVIQSHILFNPNAHDCYQY